MRKRGRRHWAEPSLDAGAEPGSDHTGVAQRPPGRRSPSPRKATVTPDYLRRAALHYLERYSSSAENLRRVLLRKARRRAEPGAEDHDVRRMIADVVARLVDTSLVDDASYADMKVRSLAGRGASTRSIATRLTAKGVPPDAIAAALEQNQPDDLALARRYAQRRRLGPWRSDPVACQRERDLAAMARAGFSYHVAAAVLDGDAQGDDPP